MFSILHSIVSDNGRQFDNKNVRDLCKEFGIKKKLSSPHHQQANGQVETVNKTIKYTLRESKMPQKELGLMSYIRSYGPLKQQVKLQLAKPHSL